MSYKAICMGTGKEVEFKSAVDWREAIASPGYAVEGSKKAKKAGKKEKKEKKEKTK